MPKIIVLSSTFFLSDAFFLVIMTIAIGIIFDDYVLLAADTRVTQPDINRKTLEYTDDNEKIYNTNLGIATGVGDVKLIGRVNDRFKQIDELIDTGLLLKMVDEERDLHRSRFHDSRIIHRRKHRKNGLDFQLCNY